MDGPSFLRQLIIRGFIMESAGLVRALHDDETLETYIRRATVGVWHCSCSCRMGPDRSASVVDPRLRVHGIESLRVIDASIFPTITSGNTNAPSIMVGERGAELIQEE